MKSFFPSRHPNPSVPLPAIQWFFLACLCLSLLGAGAQTVSPSQKKTLLVNQLSSFLQAQVDSGKIPGAVIMIKQNGHLICSKAFGYARLYDNSHRKMDSPEKMSVGTLFDLASLTKVIGTTTAIMLLVDRGLIRVDDPVGKYIRAFDSGAKAGIRIRHLLTHSAGLTEWYPLFYRCANKDETYRLIGSLPLKYPVGAGRHYSDLGFILLGEIIEKVSGMPLETFLQKEIFKPLGMDSTLYTPKITGRFTHFAATSFGNPYEKRMVYDSSLGFTTKDINPAEWNGWRNYVLSGEVNDGNAWYANGGIAGHAGLFSTASDLQRLIDMLMNGGMNGRHRFISEKTVRLFLTQDAFKNGLGWMMDPDNAFMKNGPQGSFGHTGFTGTSIAVVPKLHFSVILLINRQQTGLLSSGEYFNVNPIRRQVFDLLMQYCR